MQFQGSDTATEPLISAWWTPGWTSQHPSYIPVPANQFAEQGFPAGLTYITITGNYFDADANPLAGYLTMWPSSSLQFNVSGKIAVLSQRFIGVNQLNFGFRQYETGRIYLFGGQFQVSVLATDNANMTPSSFSYHIKENWLGGLEYDISVPSSYGTSFVDIHNLITGYGRVM